MHAEQNVIANISILFYAINFGHYTFKDPGTNFLTNFLIKSRHCDVRSNLKAHASSDRCKIASSAEKTFSQ